MPERKAHWNSIKAAFHDDEGRLHRDNGPAMIHHDGEEWWVHGQLHRETGPAWIEPRGEWWFMRGNEITEQVLDWIDENAISPTWREWDAATWLLFQVSFGEELAHSPMET
jgi:hypothetical protein